MKSSVITFFLAAAFLPQTVDAEIALKGSGGPSLAQGRNLTSGWAFTVSSMIDVTQLGVLDDYGNGLIGNQKISIWRVSDQSRIATASIAQGSVGAGPSKIVFQAIAPVTLLPNTQYILTFFQSNSPTGDGFLTASNGLTIGNGINIENSTRETSSDAFSTQTFTGAGSIPFGPTFEFSLTKFQIAITYRPS